MVNQLRSLAVEEHLIVLNVVDRDLLIARRQDFNSDFLRKAFFLTTIVVVVALQAN